MIPLIGLEEHFLSANAATGPYSEQLKFLKDVMPKLSDLGSFRLGEMDKGGITIQVISHAPGMGVEAPEVCAAANNQLYQAVKGNPDRFAAFAVLSMAQPADAANELRRCVVEMGFVGALIDNHLDGKHYDSVEFWSLFEAAQELDVPIYLHPTWPPQSLSEQLYSGSYHPGAAISLGSSGFGWHADTHLHVLKLFAAGVFDEFPTLKIVIGHMGEMLPFQLERITYLSGRWGQRRRPFQEVYDNNIWITTSGVWSINPMACILRNTKIDHILFSVDYPFAQNEWGLKFMEDLQKSGLVTEEQFEKIGYRNAENLLRIRIKREAIV